jgi:CRP-like cAMP-binding protein
MARSLPLEQRRPIEMALRCLASTRSEDRLLAWLEFNPNRKAIHREIAAECGIRRETVTRTIARLRRRVDGEKHPIH